MAFITLEDLLGTIEVVVFPKKYEQYRQYFFHIHSLLDKIYQNPFFPLLQENPVKTSVRSEQYRQYLDQDAKIFVYGRASISEDEGKVLLEKVIPFTEVPRQLYCLMYWLSYFPLYPVHISIRSVLS